VNLRRTGARPLVIGHRGARAVAAENSLAALEAAIDAGADIVEFDVVPGLRLAHDPHDVTDDSPTLDDALAFLAAATGVGVHLDIKLAGYEAGVVEAVERHGLRERALFSTAYPSVSRRLAALAPGLPVAIGYPRDSYGVSRLRWPAAATRAGAAALRQAMPVRIPLLLAVARANALSLHHALCSRAAVATAQRLGAPVLAWTINDEKALRRVVAAGVDGIVTDDPKTLLATLNRP
jgi:glycerophosphoryl diester phosphodiesterase